MNYVVFYLCTYPVYIFVNCNPPHQTHQSALDVGAFCMAALLPAAWLCVVLRPGLPAYGMQGSVVEEEVAARASVSEAVIVPLGTLVSKYCLRRCAASARGWMADASRIVFFLLAPV